MSLPEWVEPRQFQQEAVEEVIEGFRRADVVVLDAPTGSGKTIIAEMVRQKLFGKVKSSYICSSLTLQDQFARDFPYAAVAKGRSNYPLGVGGTAEKCSGGTCELCVPRSSCPYTFAKMKAAESDLACLNSTYMMYQSNMDPKFWGRGFVVVDEADTMESETLKYNEVYIGKGLASKLGMDIPKAKVRHTTLEKWLKDFQSRARLAMTRFDPVERRKLVGKVATITRLLAPGSEWIRQTNSRALVLKPVQVRDVGARLLWRHGEKFLLMSGTIVSPSLLLDDLGCDRSWESVVVPMQFPVENRLIHVPVDAVKMSHKQKATAWPEMAVKLAQVVEAHPDEKVLVHTVSYALGNYLMDRLSPRMSRPVFAYNDSSERAESLRKFRKSRNGVMFAPSMDRGVDFPGDDARVVVVCKLPFPNLGDRVVSTRMRGPGGEQWYATNTARGLMQMTGRGVRGMDDWCHTYILDGQFKSWFPSNRRLFPKWWRDALRWGS